MIHQPSSPEILSVSSLASYNARETEKFQRREASDDRYGLELFRRAIANHDDDAWSVLYQQYAPLVLSWVTQCSSALFPLEQDDYTSILNDAWAKFAQAVSPEKLGNFPQLSSLLKYLQLCARSVALDAFRCRQARQRDASLETIEYEPSLADPADEIVSAIARQGVWQAVQRELNGEEERALLLAAIDGSTPAEIWHQYPQLFPTIKDVYRVKRNIHDRLRRNRGLRATMQSLVVAPDIERCRS